MNNPRTFTALAADQIGEDGTSWIEVMPTAEKARNGPYYFTMTSDDLKATVAYIKANPDKIPIDRDHSGDRGDASDTRAAGWFTGNAYVTAAGAKNPQGDLQDHESVWAEVKWTPTAAEEIKGGDYKFISPEWYFKQKDPKTGLMTKFAEMAAATLTNRPFFKDMAPVTASEQTSTLAELLHATGAKDERAIAKSLGKLRAVGVTGRPGVDALADAVRAATADGQSVSFDPDDLVVLQAMDDLLDEILGEPEAEDAAEAMEVVTAAADSKAPYGNVTYADPGYQKDGKKRYPLDSEEHCRAAWSYINVAKNAAKYTSDQLSKVKAKIAAALKKYTKNTPTNASKEDEMDSEVLKALGLEEDASPEEALAAVVEMREKLAITEGFDKSVLEQFAKTTASELQKDRDLARLQRETAAKQHERDREDLLSKGVEQGRILPVHKDALRAVFDATPDGAEKVRAIIEAAPQNFFAETGHGGPGPDEQPEMREYEDKRGNRIAAVADPEWLDHKAQALLAEQGKSLKTATAAEYVEALNKAQALAESPR